MGQVEFKGAGADRFEIYMTTAHVNVLHVYCCLAMLTVSLLLVMIKMLGPLTHGVRYWWAKKP